MIKLLTQSRGTYLATGISLDLSDDGQPSAEMCMRAGAGTNGPREHQRIKVELALLVKRKLFVIL